MRGNELLDKLELIEPAYIEAADAVPERKRAVRLRWGALAACLCLVLAGAFVRFGGSQSNTLQHWRRGYQAGDYFKFCAAAAEESVSSEASLDSSAIPYAETRYFSDWRSDLEESGMIPAIETHPQFTLAARYHADGSLYCVELLWHRRSIGGVKAYSDLEVLAGYEEVPSISDCIAIEVDENGTVLEPAITVTERDGIQIVARGRENAEKSLTFQTEAGWYQISGSWNDSYASVAALLDWFWEHPIDFSLFSMADGDAYSYISLAEMPEAFADVLPDFSSFGFIEEETTVSLKNGVPVQFEGHYVAHADEELVKSQEYYDTEGHTKMHWCVLAEPDVYDLDGCLGELHTLTQEQLTHVLENEDNKVKFLQNGLLVIVYPDDAAEAWALIESLMPK